MSGSRPREGQISIFDSGFRVTDRKSRSDPARRVGIRFAPDSTAARTYAGGPSARYTDGPRDDPPAAAGAIGADEPGRRRLHAPPRLPTCCEFDPIGTSSFTPSRF